MSWSLVRPYFEEILTALGHEDWPDGFATDNIPATQLDKAFHVMIPSLKGVRQNMTDQETEIDVEVQTFYKGHADPRDAIDTAVAQTELIMKECVKPSNRCDTPGILNVVYEDSLLEPLGATNDNCVKVTTSYTVRIVVAV